ncbi:AAA family ATPase [bacterium]|nr:AAA family ATPase [bacterium]
MGDDLFIAPPRPRKVKAEHIPLAERLRPKALDEVIGQEHLMEEGGPLAGILASGQLRSLIFWGPPGSGKTTLARLLAEHFHMPYVALPAVTSGAVAIRDVCEDARKHHADLGPTLVFADEIHRFNRAQQDVFLPYLEEGSVILIGATTENPSFELNAALLSRATVLVLHAFDEPHLADLLTRAERLEGKKLPLTDEARATLVSMAQGDARYALGLSEQLWQAALKKPLDVAGMEKLLSRRAAVYDKDRESHYNLISALHKSLRSSDVDAALYWFGRMIDGGESPAYILRRMVRFASEDIGMADSNALLVTQSAWDAYDRMGSPEGELCIAHAVVYLATAPKSNRVYMAWNAAFREAKATSHAMPPMHSVNAPTKLMKDLGYSKGYEYDHELGTGDASSGLDYFPESVGRKSFYQPKQAGQEAVIAERLTRWRAAREKRQKEKTS